MLYEQASQWAQEQTGVEFTQEQENAIVEFLADRHEVFGDDDLVCTGTEVILAAIHLGIIPRDNAYCIRQGLYAKALPPVKMTRRALLTRIEALMSLPDGRGHHEALMALADYLGEEHEMMRLQAAATLAMQESSLIDDSQRQNSCYVRHEVYRRLTSVLEDEYGDLADYIRDRMDDISDHTWWSTHR